MCLFCTIACAVWETLTGQQFRVSAFSRKIYMFLHKGTGKLYTYVVSERIVLKIDYHQFKIFQIYLEWDTLVPSDPAGGAIVIALLVFFSYAIVLNTVVPISLYVRYVKEFFKIILNEF